MRDIRAPLPLFQQYPGVQLDSRLGRHLIARILDMRLELDIGSDVRKRISTLSHKLASTVYDVKDNLSAIVADLRLAAQRLES